MAGAGSATAVGANPEGGNQEAHRQKRTVSNPLAAPESKRAHENRTQAEKRRPSVIPETLYDRTQDETMASGKLRPEGKQVSASSAQPDMQTS